MLADTRKPQGHALRKGRFSEPGRIYLISTVTHGRRAVFSELVVGRLVVRALRDCNQQAESLAFVIMPDHMHWLFTLVQGCNLSTVVGSMKGRSARAVNLHRRQRHQTPITPLWQKGFHDHALRVEEDIVDIARYIVANPLRAGLVKSIGDYPLWDAIWL
ncbi:MAG: transposase [Gallionellales bacterium RBG_16_56_9]|nr:MAG: transposase [Gallionellales bacterium RBG_16_56_9]